MDAKVELIRCSLSCFINQFRKYPVKEEFRSKCHKYKDSEWIMSKPPY